MKTKKKGFSLVELICTLTIAAIIAVAAAPNVSAYILNSKIQNYQTALNNLVDELQTKLPQTRYWNWQEVKDNTEEILTSDISRNVSAPDIDGSKYTYTLSNVSTDSNVEFSLSVEYGTASATTQDITISGECVGYDAVKSENNTCTVLLKGNYVDRDRFPHTITTTKTVDNSGWKTMDDRVRTMPEWNEFFADANNDKYKWDKFNPILNEVDGSVYRINTTDYPLNDVKMVQFGLKAYDQKSIILYHSLVLSTLTVQVQEGTNQNSWECMDPNGYPIFGTGTQYQVPKENIYIYLGDNNKDSDFSFVSTKTDKDELNAEMAAHNWYKYSDVLNSSSGVSVVNSPLGNAFLHKYYISHHFKSTSTGTPCFPNTPNPVVYYRVLLQTATQESCGGAILAVGSNNMNVEKESVRVYVDYTKTRDPSIYHQSMVPTSSMFVPSGLTPIADEPNFYTQTSTGYRVKRDSGNNNVTVYVPMPSQSEAGYYGYSYQITDDGDGKGKYIPYFDTSNQIIKKIYFSELGILDGYSGYYLYDSRTMMEVYYNTDSTSPFLEKMFQQTVYINLINTGYHVGDKLVVTVTGVNVNYLIANVNDSSKFSILMQRQMGEYAGTFPLPSSDKIKIEPDASDSRKARIIIPWEWRTYPYLKLMFDGALADVGAEVSLNWEGGNTSTNITTEGDFIPAVTVNGNNKYTVLTLDWSKCGYINSSNLSSVAINFSETLKYTIYDKNYNKIGYNSPCCSNYLCNSNNFYPTLITDANALSDRVVHLYFEGISSSEISYTLSYPESEGAPVTQTVLDYPSENLGQSIAQLAGSVGLDISNYFYKTAADEKIPTRIVMVLNDPTTGKNGTYNFKLSITASDNTISIDPNHMKDNDHEGDTYNIIPTVDNTNGMISNAYLKFSFANNEDHKNKNQNTIQSLKFYY